MATNAHDRYLQRAQVGYARVDDRATHTHAHVAARHQAGRPLHAAENTMVEICTNHPSEAQATDAIPCPHAEHFSGYIITTAR